MRGWYRAAVDNTPTLARIRTEQIMAEGVELYHAVPSQERISPHPYRQPNFKIPYLHRRRSSGRCGYYGGTSQKAPPRCATSTSRSVYDNLGQIKQQCKWRKKKRCESQRVGREGPRIGDRTGGGDRQHSGKENSQRRRPGTWWS